MRKKPEANITDESALASQVATILRAGCALTLAEELRNIGVNREKLTRLLHDNPILFQTLGNMMADWKQWPAGTGMMLDAVARLCPQLLEMANSDGRTIFGYFIEQAVATNMGVDPGEEWRFRKNWFDPKTLEIRDLTRDPPGVQEFAHQLRSFHNFFTVLKVDVQQLADYPRILELMNQITPAPTTIGAHTMRLLTQQPSTREIK